MKTHHDFALHFGDGRGHGFDLDDDVMDYLPEPDEDVYEERSHRSRRRKNDEADIVALKARRIIEKLRDQKKLRQELDAWFENDFKDEKK